MEGNAENLEAVESNAFDAYTIAFGIRNCTHVDKVNRICGLYNVTGTLNSFKLAFPNGHVIVNEHLQWRLAILREAWFVLVFDSMHHFNVKYCRF